MLLKPIAIGIAALVALPAINAQTPGLPAINFATIDRGRDVLTSRDDFVSRLSPFDRAARMKTDKDVSEEEYLRFVAANVLDWTPGDRWAVESAWAVLAPRLSGMRLPLPETIDFIKTSGQEEGDGEYTRGNAIMLPKSQLNPAKQAGLREIIAHELFHVLSRNAPQMRDRLYAVIGFQPCGEIPFPVALASRKITNPDAPVNGHCVRVSDGTGPAWVLPILYSKTARYDSAKGGAFFEYAKLSFLVVSRASVPAPAEYDPAMPILLEPEQLQAFYEQIGRNTKYIIHPEEILADNFRLLLLGKNDVPSPQILQHLSTALGTQ